jgi:hypothetical protein
MNQSYVNEDLPTYSQTVARNNEYLAEHKLEKDEPTYELDIAEEIDEETQREIDLYTRLVKHIHDTYPLRYVKIDSAANILLNIAVIVFQILATSQNAALSSYGTAVWGAIYNITIASLALLTSEFWFIYLGKVERLKNLTG